MDSRVLHDKTLDGAFSSAKKITLGVVIVVTLTMLESALSYCSLVNNGCFLGPSYSTVVCILVRMKSFLRF